MDSRFTRRQVLGGSARLGLALAAGVPLLQACGDSGGGSSGGKQTKAIADGLEPETGTLRIFNYDSYVNPDLVTAFEEKYGVKVEITTFTTDDEAITKIASGAVDVDLASQRIDHHALQVGRIGPDPAAQQDLPDEHRQCRRTRCGIRITTRAACTRFRTPCSARASAFAPTGSTLARVSWETLWNPEYKGVTSMLDEYREGLSAPMMRKGLTDVNTGDPAVIKQAGDDLGELTNLMNIKVEIEGYHTIPEGATTVAHTWSGDMLNARRVPARGHRARGAGVLAA